MHKNVVIICLIQSTFAIFHHHKIPPHTKIHVCLTPPNTMVKVQKHIMECQNEVKSNIFHEAFSLIHDTAFRHPDDHAHIEYSEHDQFAHRNFTVTEQEILKFFEKHDRPKGHLGAISGHLSANSGHSSGDYIESVEVSDEHHESDLHNPPNEHSLEHSIEHNPHPYEHTRHHVPNVHQPHGNWMNGWQQSYPESFYKKTDAMALNGQPDDAQRLMRAIPKRNPYTYFNIKTGEAVKNQERPRRDVHAPDIHADPHSHTDIHPTTASFKDKRIAGCLMHCLYEKDHAIDPHTGYPTLDGLVNFYSDGVHEHGFFMTTLRAVDFCLKGASLKYHINRHIKPSAGISCDLAFDIFDCVSDRITEYCSKHHFHEEYHHHHPAEHAIHSHEEYHDDEAYYY